MTRQVLLIDQGNTRIKWAGSVGRELDPGRFGHGTPEVFEKTMGELPWWPDDIVISSVAGADQQQAIARCCRNLWGLEAKCLTSVSEQGGVRNAYRDPSMLGVDRWLAIVGAVARYGKPVVIWDLGTASTLDAVDSSGRHLGGMIYPGPATMLRSLKNDTRLNVPDDFEEAGIISWVGAGQNTDECILKGVLAAQVGTLNQFLRHVSLQMDCEPKLIVTGGAAEKILPLVDFEKTHDPWLVFRGMLID